MANTEENRTLLEELTQDFTIGHESTYSIEVLLDTPEECQRVREELSVRSSQFDPV